MSIIPKVLISNKYVAHGGSPTAFGLDGHVTKRVKAPIITPVFTLQNGMELWRDTLQHPNVAAIHLGHLGAEVLVQVKPEDSIVRTQNYFELSGSQMVCRRFDALMQSGSDVQFFFAQYHGRVWGGVVPLACCVRFGIQSNHTCGALPTQTWPNPC